MYRLSYSTIKQHQSPYDYVRQCLGPQKDWVLDISSFKNKLDSLALKLTDIKIKKLYHLCTVPQQNRKYRSISAFTHRFLNSKIQIDLHQLTNWIIKNIQNIRILKNPPKNKKIEKLPIIPKLLKIIRTKLQKELQPLIQIFDKMEEAREQSGLIPVELNIKSEDQQDSMLQLQYKHIPYDPDLIILNNKLNQYRVKAQSQIKKVLIFYQLIQLAKNDPKIRWKLQSGIKKFQKERIIANQKIGRMGALNAKKRLIEKKKIKQMQKETNLEQFLAIGENCIRAGKIYQLLKLQYKNPYLVI